MIYLQPEDWDDKEYIPDPEDKKPEVMMPDSSRSCLVSKFVTYNLSICILKFPCFV